MMTEIKSQLHDWAESRNDIVFAYFHGSQVQPEIVSARDADIAIYLNPDVFAEHKREADLEWNLTIPAELELEELLNAPVDLQVLNEAPLGFRYKVVSTGNVLCDKSPDKRDEFEYLARVEFFDFRPRQMEYLREAAAV